MAQKVVNNAALRQRLRAARRREGLIVVPVVVSEIDTIAVLEAEGYLLGNEPSRQELGEALSRWVFKELLTREGQLWP